MKAIISNRIYLNKPDEGFDDIKKALTYKIEHKAAGRGGKHSVIEVIKNYKLLPRDIISIPQGRTDLIPEGYEIIDKRILVDMPFPDPRVQLRPEQAEVINKLTDTCIVNAPVGWGKSYSALHAVCNLGQKALIVTHNTLLRDQWVEGVQEIFGFTPAVIGSGAFDMDSAIVVGNIQTLSKNLLELSKEFGTIVVDECHKTPATTFTDLVDSSYARYRIGLSGTVKRKDGKHVILRDYFGTTLYKPEQSHTLNPVVKLLKPGVSLSIGDVWAKKINNLLYDPDYQEYISVIAKAQMAKGHSVLIVADRVEFLNNVKELIGEDCMCITGETSFEERKTIADRVEEGTTTAVAASRSIFSEGISINRLSCIILATPIANEVLLEQLIGRIMRLHPKKIQPEVIDIQFSGPADRKQNNLRTKFYLEKGWRLVSI